MADVVAGQSNVLFNGMLATYPSVKSGRLRGIAMTGAQRAPSAPELPTLIESGLPGFVTGSYQGLLAPANTPRETILKLNSELKRILNTQDMKDMLAKQGTEVRADTPEQLASFVAREKDRWAKVVKEAGIKAD